MDTFIYRVLGWLVVLAFLCCVADEVRGWFW